MRNMWIASVLALAACHHELPVAKTKTWKGQLCRVDCRPWQQGSYTIELPSDSVFDEGLGISSWHGDGRDVNLFADFRAQRTSSDPFAAVIETIAGDPGLKSGNPACGSSPRGFVISGSTDSEGYAVHCVNGPTQWTRRVIVHGEHTVICIEHRESHQAEPWTACDSLRIEFPAPRPKDPTDPDLLAPMVPESISVRATHGVVAGEIRLPPHFYRLQASSSNDQIYEGPTDYGPYVRISGAEPPLCAAVRTETDGDATIRTCRGVTEVSRKIPIGDSFVTCTAELTTSVDGRPLATPAIEEKQIRDAVAVCQSLKVVDYAPAEKL